ncbi:hypothetical protein QBZ16_004254 [Prototheca wickerhamii]|uniref:Myb-like domain-containing protein n=1 Tax=Prototheca wickerhamii TaxID=3111 RepID=A0AAD9IHV8_PROWI|nr:hypothetical protein QBZ16_004254 [Prototheca wickerhamii]
MNFDLSALDSLDAKLKGAESKNARFAPRLGARGRPKKPAEEAVNDRPRQPPGDAAEPGPLSAAAARSPSKARAPAATPSKRPIDALIAAANEHGEARKAVAGGELAAARDEARSAASPATPLPKRGRPAKSGASAGAMATPGPAATDATPPTRRRGRPRKVSPDAPSSTPSPRSAEPASETLQSPAPSAATEEEKGLALAIRRGVETMAAKSLTAEEAGRMSLRALVAWGNLRDRRLAAEGKLRAAAAARAARPAGRRRPAPAPAASLVPQVAVGADGRIVIAETSLVVQAQEQPPERRVVTEEHFTLNSTTYSNRLSNERWNAEDTELFYKALSQFGTDFTLISHLFPGRQRPHLKNKFKRESKRDPKRVDAALEASAKASATSYQDMIAMLKAGVAISEQGDAGVPGAVGPVSLPA